MKRGADVLAVALLFFVLTWLTVGLRIYVRGYMLKTWGRDDWYMVLTLAIFTIYLAFQITAVMYGTGRHRWELSDHDASTALLFWYLCELLYALSNCTLKLALGIFYLRVAIERWHVWCIRILMAGAVLFSTVYFFLVMFQCIPVSEFWLNHPASSKCIPEGPTIGITYALGAVNAFADWSFGILPFFIVWNLQMHIRTKLLVAGILAFAAIGSTATVVRMQYVHSLTNGPDFLFATKNVAIWSTVEPGIGITAGSMATLRPLLQYVLWRLGLASVPESARARTPSHPSRLRSKSVLNQRKSHSWLGLSDLVPSQGSTSTTISGPKSPTRPARSRAFSGRSRKETAIPDLARTPDLGGIRQSVLVEQQYEGPPRLQLRDSLRNSLMRGSMYYADTPDSKKSSNIEKGRERRVDRAEDEVV